MTRALSLILVASLIATPGMAGGLSLDLPNLTFPEPAPVTRSTASVSTAPAPAQD